MISLQDTDVAVILKYLPRNNETRMLRARLNAYLHGYEYEVQGLFDGKRVVAVYQRGKIVASREFDADTENVRDVLARMGYPRARKRHNPR